MNLLRSPLFALAIGLLLSLGVALGLASSPPTSVAQAPLMVTFLDVGQGDCIWVRTPEGQDILVDGGRKGAGLGVVEYLQSHECTEIEYMVVTHSDADHVGGLIRVLQHGLPTYNVWHNGQPTTTTATYAEFWNLVEALPITATVQRAGAVHTIGSVEVAVLHPAGLVSNANDNSIVCRLSYGSLDVMLTGDIEASAEGKILARGYALDAEVLKVAHHGSDYSSTESFLQAVLPETAVISVGPNSYGHPAPEVLARLVGLGAVVYRTDWHGTIVVTSDGQHYWIETQYTPRYLFLPLVMRQQDLARAGDWAVASSLLAK